MTRVVVVKDAVIGSLHHIARVIDQSDRSMSLSCVIVKIVLCMHHECLCISTVYAFLRFGWLIVDKKYPFMGRGSS